MVIPNRTWNRLGSLAIIVAAVLLARVLCTLDYAYQFHKYIGYSLVLASFLIGVFFFYSAGLPKKIDWNSRLKEHRVGLLVITAGAVFMQVHEPHVLRVLHDESTHAAGGLTMHLTKMAFLPGKAHYVNGVYLLGDYYASFRQYLFQVLLSLLHDLTGYRLSNVYVLNAVLGLALLVFTYLAAWRCAGKFGACTSVGLVTTLPLLAQNINSGGYDVLNLALVSVLFCSALAYTREEDVAQRLRLMNLGTATAILLALSRYESILYLFLWSLVVMVRWRQLEKIEVTLYSILSPVFLLPNLISHYILYNSNIVTAGPRLLPGHSYFELGYLRDHIEEALYYFFDLSLHSTSSVLLSLAGAIGSVFLFVFVVRNFRTVSAEAKLLVAFLLWTSAMYLVVLTQYWSSPTDPLASRFSLPLFLMLALVVGWFVQHWAHIKAFRSGVIITLGLWVIMYAAPAESNAFSTNAMPVSRAESWCMSQASEYDRQSTLFASASNVHLIASRFASVSLSAICTDPVKCIRAIRAGLYNQIIIYRLLHLDPKTGEWMPGDKEFAENLVLDLVKEIQVGPNYRAVLYRLAGYRNSEGKLVTPTSTDPIIQLQAGFSSDREAEAYRLSLYP